MPQNPEHKGRGQEWKHHHVRGSVIREESSQELLGERNVLIARACEYWRKALVL